MNINTFNKPEWFLKLNPIGKVPVLQYDDGRVIPESNIVCEYLDEVYGTEKLMPQDSYTKALHRLEIDQFNKVIAWFYKVLVHNDEKALLSLTKYFDGLEIKLAGSAFLGGKILGINRFFYKSE